MAVYKDVEPLEVATWESDNEKFDRGVIFILEKLDALPTADVVEVVRCRDCKKFIEKGEEFLKNDVYGFCEKSRTGFFDDGEEVYGIPRPLNN